MTIEKNVSKIDYDPDKTLYFGFDWFDSSEDDINTTAAKACYLWTAICSEYPHDWQEYQEYIQHSLTPFKTKFEKPEYRFLSADEFEFQGEIDGNSNLKELVKYTKESPQNLVNFLFGKSDIKVFGDADRDAIKQVRAIDRDKFDYFEG